MKYFKISKLFHHLSSQLANIAWTVNCVWVFRSEIEYNYTSHLFNKKTKKLVKLNEAERVLLESLIQSNFLTKDEVINIVWGQRDVIVADSSYYKLISNLRRKFLSISLQELDFFLVIPKRGIEISCPVNKLERRSLTKLMLVLLISILLIITITLFITIIGANEKEIQWNEPHSFLYKNSKVYILSSNSSSEDAVRALTVASESNLLRYKKANYYYYLAGKNEILLECVNEIEKEEKCEAILISKF